MALLRPFTRSLTSKILWAQGFLWDYAVPIRGAFTWVLASICATSRVPEFALPRVQGFVKVHYGTIRLNPIQQGYVRLSSQLAAGATNCFDPIKAIPQQAVVSREK